MLGHLKSLGQTIVSLRHAAAEGVAGMLANYRTRKLPAHFDRKLRGEIAASRCATCAAPVGREPFRDHDVPGRYYCSFDCLNVALIRRDIELDEKMTRQPVALTEDEQALLVGTSSPGMYYERGRCVRCGDPLADRRAVFGFCSATCDERATKPYTTFTQQLADSDEHMQAVKDREAFIRNEPEIVAEVKKRREKETMTDGEIREYLDKQLRSAELLYDRRKRFDAGEARVSFLKKWELQRGYMLEQEKRKAAKPQDGS